MQVHAECSIMTVLNAYLTIGRLSGLENMLLRH